MSTAEAKLLPFADGERMQVMPPAWAKNEIETTQMMKNLALMVRQSLVVETIKTLKVENMVKRMMNKKSRIWDMKTDNSTLTKSFQF
jgi:hypothetical protein